MVFSSIPFLYYFLPIFLLLYFALPRQCRNTVLVLSSLFFYGWEEPVFVVLMAVSITVSYFFGRMIHHFSAKARLSEFFLVLAVVFQCLLLLYFKYTDFLIGSVNSVTGSSIPLKEIALPLGISFYTFQILSYLIDLHRGDVVAEKNFIRYAAYVCMFPQLVAGPIVRYQDIAGSLKARTITSHALSRGITRFLLGLTKKVILADQLGKLVLSYREASAPSVLFAWISAIAYTLQIYFDFSGYSDMAIGLGRMLGFRFPENFDHPYESASITEFWRRWHMTLGGWFRDYVYIPLGGSRRGRAKLLRNLLLVWGLTGLWHGASWNYVLWGLFYAALLSLEKMLLGNLLSRRNPLCRIASHGYVLLATVLGFVLFQSGSVPAAAKEYRRLLGLGGLPAATQETVYYLVSYSVLLLLSMLFATSLPKRIAVAVLGRIKMRSRSLADGFQRLLLFLRAPALLLLLLLCTAYLLDESFHPFLYFKF